MGYWDFFIWAPLLVVPLVVGCSIVVRQNGHVGFDEILCLLTIPATLYHMFVMVRVLRRIPHIGVVPGHVVVIGSYAVICFLILVRHSLAKRPTGRIEKLARWFGLLYFGFLTVTYSVAWVFPPI